ncbi:MAG: hypothetical protein ACRD82_12590, partial [Blastocatellia bacterium]
AADGATMTEPELDERIAVGFETTVRISGKDQSGKRKPGTNGVWSCAARVSPARRHSRSTNESNARKKRSPRSTNASKASRDSRREQAQAAAQRIAENHRVAEFLRIEVECEVTERSKRADGARPATTLREEHCLVQTTVKEQELEQAARRLGWRVYATNQKAAELPLRKAVWAYREQYQVEQGFGRLKGCPLSLTRSICNLNIGQSA